MNFIYKARIKVWKIWGYKIAVLEILSTTVAVRLLIHPVFNSLPEEVDCRVRHRNVQKELNKNAINVQLSNIFSNASSNPINSIHQVNFSNLYYFYFIYVCCE